MYASATALPTSAIPRWWGGSFLRFHFEAALKSYASILFSDRKLIGCIALAATFFNPRAGLYGVFALSIANALARIIGVHEDKIRKGLIGIEV